MGPFEWATVPTGGPTDDTTQSQTTGSVDANGNFYTDQRVFDRTGALVWDTVTDLDLVSAINAYAGFTLIPVPGAPSKIIAASPILGGQYLITMHTTIANSVSFYFWWIILEIPPPGSFNHLVVLGLVRYQTLLGVPYTSWISTITLNTQTINDPMLILGNVNIGAFVQLFAILPSVDDLLSGTYAAGWGGAFSLPYLIPYAVYDIAPGAHGDLVDLFFTNAEPDSPGLGIGIGSAFALPAPGASTNIYQYLSRSRMAYEAAGGTGGGFFCPEIKNVIAPAHPLGEMMKLNVPSITFGTAVTIALANNVRVGDGYLIANLTYTLDGPAWGMPFTDEWTYLTNGLVGGNDAYQANVAFRGRLPSGEWFVAFMMPGAYDADANWSLPPPSDAFKRLQMKAIRGFIYDPSSGNPSTILPRVKGIAYTHDDIPFPVNEAAFENYWEILDPIQTGPDSYDVHIYGSTNAGSPLWRTRLHNVRSASTQPWLQINT
jgi:hypothetical protein